jgi:ATP-dependent protease HslVU (ClpYQ) peptidase subunit
MQKYRDEIAEVCHEIVKDGYSLGIITDDEMTEFEADCLVQEPETTYTVEKSPKTEYAAATK